MRRRIEEGNHIKPVGTDVLGGPDSIKKSYQNNRSVTQNNIVAIQCLYIFLTTSYRRQLVAWTHGPYRVRYILFMRIIAALYCKIWPAFSFVCVRRKRKSYLKENAVRGVSPSADGNQGSAFGNRKFFKKTLLKTFFVGAVLTLQ